LGISGTSSNISVSLSAQYLYYKIGLLLEEYLLLLIFAFSKKKFYRGKNKCNVDAALCNHQQCFGVGMCIREEHGQFIKAKTVLHRGIPEAWGLWLQEDKLIIQLLS